MTTELPRALSGYSQEQPKGDAPVNVSRREGARGTVINLSSWISVNNLFQNVNGRGRIVSNEYRIWRDRAGWELLEQRPAKIKGPVSVKYEFREGRADLSNLVKATEDLLVTHGVIEGDGPKIVRHIEMCFADVEGVRVTVCPV